MTDYGDISGLGFTFQPGSTRDCVTISTVDDRDIESNERFSLSLLSPSSQVMVRIGSPSSATITILDNEETTSQPPSSGLDSVVVAIQVVSIDLDHIAVNP